MLVRLLLLAVFVLMAFAPLAPRPDYAGLYRDAPHLAVDTRREGDSLRLYLRLPAPTRLGPGHPLRLAAWPSYEAKVPLWQDSIARRRQHPRLEADGSLRLSFCIAAARVPAGAILQLSTAPTDAKDDYQEPTTTAWLRLTEAVLARPFVLTDSVGQPLARRYVRVGETFGVDSYGLMQPVRWKRYAVTPTPAPAAHDQPGRHARRPAPAARARLGRGSARRAAALPRARPVCAAGGRRGRHAHPHAGRAGGGQQLPRPHHGVGTD